MFRSAHLATGPLLACALLLAGCGGSPPKSTTINASYDTAAPPVTLRSAAAQRGIVFGVAVQSGDLQNDSAFAAQVAEQAGILVPENELKWETTEPQPGQFNFAPGDWLLGFARDHDMQFRGHTLVWYRQLPAWAGTGDAETVRQQLTSHISAEVAHYAGRVQSWDVVNEAVEPLDGRSDGLRNNVWLQALGPAYIDIAFRAAAAADANAVLVYNDYGLEYDSSDGDRRRAAVLALLTNLKRQGTPVGALGIQAHLTSAANGSFNAGKFSAFLQSVAALGLKIYVTELDVADSVPAGDVATRDAKVAQAYQQFLAAALQQPAVAAVITWGLSDRYTWLTTYAPRPDGSPVRPLPLDSNLAQKSAWTALRDALASAPAR